VVLAEAQTAGRGRLDRAWHSVPESGLYLSIVLRPKIAPSAAPLMTLLAAVAVHDAIENVGGVSVDIKWPNDLLVDGKKVCGILAQLRADTDRVHALVVGIGVNVNHAAFPDDLAQRATSLMLASGRAQSRLEILVEILGEFERRLDVYAKEGPSSIIDAWMERSPFANGHRIRIDDGFRAVEGVTRGLNRFGGLRIEGPAGVIEDFYSGDICAQRRID
jgi:BirA family biotin operon repressor/biotin-[acetyl-CoA-carboxylase] ligase